MIEIPRAALTADEIAEHADFFSFGTNDLTQMTFGYSRDDINTSCPTTCQARIAARRPVPIAGLNRVGQLVEMGVNKGRSIEEEVEDRYLWRARWRPRVDRVLQ